MAQKQTIANETAALYATGDRSDRYTADALKKLNDSLNGLQSTVSGISSVAASTSGTISHA